ncbi:MAG: hypothetical protein ACUVS7_09515 [Bryobacteraceae bacterium]
MRKGNLYLHDVPVALRFEVCGPLDAPLAAEILSSLSTALSIRNGRPLILDLRRAEKMDASAAALLAGLPVSEMRVLAREDHLQHVAAALPRRPRPASEARLPLLRRFWCAVLERLRPHCACPSCHPARIWVF